MKAIIITLLIFLLLFGIIGFMICKDVKEGKALSENKFIQFFIGKLPSWPKDQSLETTQGTKDASESKETT